MTPDNKYRITKDISSRKSTTMENSVSHVEHTATKAMFEAYINSIKESHEKILENIHAEHAKELAALTTQFNSDITSVRAELKNEKQTVAAKEEVAAAEATRQAQAQNTEATNALRNKVSNLEMQLENTQTDLKSALDKGVRLQSQMKTLQGAHANEVKKLEGKLAVGPNSWIQVKFRWRKSPKVRTYWRRYTTKMGEAAQEVLQDVGGGLSVNEYVFRRGGDIGLACDLRKTLQEVSGQTELQRAWQGCVLKCVC